VNEKDIAGQELDAALSNYFDHVLPKMGVKVDKTTYAYFKMPVGDYFNKYHEVLGECSVLLM